MDDNRHTESQSQELTEGDVPNLLLFVERDVIDRVRTEAAGSVAQVAGRDTRRARAFAQTEIKRHRQGLRKNELSSSDVLESPSRSCSPVDPAAGRTKSVAPHHEPDITHHDAC